MRFAFPRRWRSSDKSGGSSHYLVLPPEIVIASFRWLSVLRGEEKVQVCRTRGSEQYWIISNNPREQKTAKKIKFYYFLLKRLNCIDNIHPMNGIVCARDGKYGRDLCAPAKVLSLFMIIIKFPPCCSSGSRASFFCKVDFIKTFRLSWWQNFITLLALESLSLLAFPWTESFQGRAWWLFWCGCFITSAGVIEMKIFFLRVATFRFHSI